MLVSSSVCTQLSNGPIGSCESFVQLHCPIQNKHLYGIGQTICDILLSQNLNLWTLTKMSRISGLPEELLEVLGSLITQDMKPTQSLRRSSGQISVFMKQTTKFRAKTTSHKAVQCDSPSFTKLQIGDLDIHTDRIPHQSVVITKSTHRSEPGKKKKSPSTRKRDHLGLIKWRTSRHGKHHSNAPKLPHLPLPLEISLWIAQPFLWNMKQQMYDLELLRHAEKLTITRTGENLMCFNFSKPGLESPGILKRCVKCTNALYCSKDCQKLYWKSAHKFICDANLPQQIQDQTGITHS